MIDRKTVLVFGYIQDGGAICQKIAWGDEAYDKFQLAAYLPEIIRVRKNKSDCGGLFAELAPYAQGCNSLWELGSTLFASIDKYSNCKALHDLPDISFVGVEPSDILRDTAELLHPEAHITHYLSHTDAPKSEKAIHRSYQASSYAFNSTGELIEWVSQFQTSQDGIWFSLSGKDEIHETIGRKITLFSLPTFQQEMKKAGFSLTFHSAQKVHHIGADLVEVFVLAHQGEISEAKSLEDIKWSNDRVISYYQGNYEDSKKYLHMLNFTNRQLILDAGSLHRTANLARIDFTLITALSGPYDHVDGYCWGVSWPNTIGDSVAYPNRSHLVLLEHGKMIGEAHALHAKIKKAGMGLYSHWGEYLYFSTSDNSDPNTNGRFYEVGQHD